MTFCSKCYKQISNNGNLLARSPEPFYSSMEEDREMSRFLYRLTQEIVTSRDYSDANISRICNKFYQRSNYPDKARLARTINDLKQKLEVQHSDMEYGSSDTSDKSKDRRCSCSKSKRHRKQMDAGSHLDKCISAQSFGKLPGMLVNCATQMQGTLYTETKCSTTDDATDRLKKCLSKEDSTDSISTITTYNFSSSLYPPFSAQSLEDMQTLVEEQILPKLGGDQKDELMEGCCGGRNKNAEDSSVDMVMRMAASDRVFGGHGERRCRLQRCEAFGHNSTCGVSGGGGGGCGRGCASDFPLPRLKTEETETPPAGCCGKRKKPKITGKGNGVKRKDVEKERCVRK